MKLAKMFLCNGFNDNTLIDDVICYVKKEQMKKVINDQAVEHYMASRERMYKKVKGSVNILAT
jgi:hypothetical protein